MKNQNTLILKYLTSLLFVFSVATINAQVVYTFTNCGSDGREGPSQADVNSEYSGTNLDNQVISNDGIQVWDVPAGGLYRIKAYGAQGSGAHGGKGAIMEGEFLFTGNEQLEILVGQEGTDDDNGHGGGGGSFVVMNGQPLVVAGGGGGNDNTPDPGADADTAIDGKDGVGGSGFGNGGINGDPGQGTSRSHGAAGWNGNGGGFTGDDPESFNNGGKGGARTPPDGGIGGFGGGGGSYNTGWRGSGGGGGYSGGGGGYQTSNPGSHRGGGGGSYNTGMNQLNTPGANTGHGMVIFEYFGNDAGITELVEPGMPNCLGEDLYVNIETVGADPLTSVEIHWSVDGVTQQPYFWSGFIPAQSSSQQPIHVGSYPFQKGQEVKAWTMMPNGNPDDFPGNDTASFTIPNFPDAASLPDEILLCDGSSERIETGLPNLGHKWSTGEEFDSFIDVTEGGIYKVTVTDGGAGGSNCQHVYEVVVKEDQPVNLPDEIFACEIDGPVTIQANVPNKDYFWPLLGHSGSMISVTASGSYVVEATDPTGKCFSRDTTDVIFEDIPSPDFVSRYSFNSAVFTNLTPDARDFFWEFGDGNTSTEENPTHLYDGPGEYEVKLTATNSCGSSSKTMTAYIAPASVEDLENVDGIKVYPNPNEGQFSVEFSGHNFEQTQLEILDMQGRTVKVENIGNVSGNMRHEINITDVAQGMYLLRVTSGKEIKAVNRVSIK